MAEERSISSKKAWYLLHSWCGIVVSLLLYVVLVSGCVVLFFHELQAWAHPELRELASDKEASIDFDQLLFNAKQNNLIEDEASLQLSHYSNALVLRVPGDVPRLAIFAPDGTLIAVKAEGFIRFLRQLHTDLLLPFPYGTYLVGFLGILLLFLICTGVVMHRQFYQQMFRLRLTKNWRLTWSDVHKLMGSWGLVFQAMMGFTGAILGLAGLLVLQTAVVAYKGDTQQAVESLIGKEVPRSGIPAVTTQYGAALARDINGEPFTPRYITIQNIGDRNATLTIEGERVGYLSGTDRKILDNSGNLIEVTRGVSNGAGWRVYSAMLPLHFGDYAGVALKFLYLILGVGAALMPVTGAFLWLQRQGSKADQRSYWLLSRLTIGVTVGLPLAIASCFILDKLAPHLLSTANRFLTVVIGCIVGATAFAVLNTHAKRALVPLLSITGAFLIGAVLANGVLTEDYFWHGLSNALSIHASVDISLLLIGALFFMVAAKLSFSRSTTTR